MLFSQLAGGFSNFSNQFSGVLAAWGQPGMGHRAMTRIGYVPFAAKPFGEIDGFSWARPNTYAATFAGRGIRGKCSLVFFAFDFADRIESAPDQAYAATDTGGQTNDCCMAAVEIFARPQRGRKHKVEVGGIHIAVCQHSTPSLP